MTQVTFHFNVADKTGYACRLLRKAVQQGARVLVTGSPAQLDELDQGLWTFSARDFLPHCRADAQAAMLAASPIVLADSTMVKQVAQEADVLLNLDGYVSLEPQGFNKWVELVSDDPDDRAAARQRWKAFLVAGCELRGHDVLQTEGRA